MNIIAKNTFVNLVHPGRGVFGSDFGTVTFTFAKNNINNYNGTYYRLFDVQGEVKSNEVREQALLSHKGKYIANQSNFYKIPGSPVAYWVSEQVFNLYSTLPKMNSFGELKHGMSTGDNNNCLRYWYEIKRKDLIVNAKTLDEFTTSGCIYIPYNKGGSYRKWYGNLDYVIGYNKKYNDYMDSLGGHRHDNQSYYFKEAITWSLTNSSYFGARFRPAGSIFDVNGMSMFVSKQFDLHYLLGFMCSKISSSFMKINNPTLASQVGDVSRLPIIYSEDKLSKVSVLVNECIDYAKTDWDSFETSWDFKKHPLI